MCWSTWWKDLIHAQKTNVINRSLEEMVVQSFKSFSSTPFPSRRSKGSNGVYRDPIGKKSGGQQWSTAVVINIRHRQLSQDGSRIQRHQWWQKTRANLNRAPSSDLAMGSCCDTTFLLSYCQVNIHMEPVHSSPWATSISGCPTQIALLGSFILCHSD